MSDEKACNWEYSCVSKPPLSLVFETRRSVVQKPGAVNGVPTGRSDWAVGVTIRAGLVRSMQALSSELCNRVVAVGAFNWVATADSEAGAITKSTLAINPMESASKPTMFVF